MFGDEQRDEMHGRATRDGYWLNGLVAGVDALFALHACVTET